MDKIFSFLAGWLSKSGDDTFWSWVITLTYIVTFAVSIYSLSKIKSRKPQRLLWIYISIFLAIMGINKQLDIQILVIMVGKFMAGRLNLSGYGETIQIIAAIGLLAVTAAITVFILFRTRNILRQSLAAASGLAILIIFVFIRALSLYVYKIHAIELLGLLFILVDRIIFLRTLNPKP